jgi:flagellar protein FlaJ
MVFPPGFLSRMKGFRSNLARASIRLSFETYFGITLFSIIISSIAAFTLSYLFFSVFMGLSLFNLYVLPILFSLLAGVITAVSCYAYPIMVYISRSRMIDANLPMIANFMSVLATSGMPPGNIIKSLTRVGKEFDVHREMRGLIVDIELLGSDLSQALRNASDRAPSKKFASLLDGVIATSHMGGDMAAYLRDQANKYKNARMLSMRTFIENLGMVAEIYVTFIVVAPIMLIVMLSVMSFIGGSVMVGNIDPKLLLYILSFFIIPVGIAIMIIIVDGMTPPR